MNYCVNGQVASPTGDQDVKKPHYSDRFYSEKQETLLFPLPLGPELPFLANLGDCFIHSLSG